jgi:competence protein ComEA
MRRASLIGALVAMLASTAWAQPSGDPVGRSSVARAPAAGESAGVVNLNDATEAELELLPGIGPAKAKAIVDHRHGHPFHKVDELMKVKGIGRKTFGRLRPYLTITGRSTLQSEIKMHR